MYRVSATSVTIFAPDKRDSIVALLLFSSTCSNNMSFGTCKPSSDCLVPVVASVAICVVSSRALAREKGCFDESFQWQRAVVRKALALNLVTAHDLGMAVQRQ